jgi:hypothetical protein
MFRHHRCIAPVIALMLTFAIAAPAFARFQSSPSTGTSSAGTPAGSSLCSEVCSASGYSAAKTGAALPHDPRPRAVALAAPSPHLTVVRVIHAPGNGFDWGDAGIGAGGALALMTLLVGSVLGVGAMRRRVTGSTA